VILNTIASQVILKTEKRVQRMMLNGHGIDGFAQLVDIVATPVQIT